jgi:hypothetical protein
MRDGDSTQEVNFLGDLGAAIRDNPLPSALIGMGLVWLFTGAKLPGRAGVMGVKAKASELGARIQDSASEIGRAVGDAATSARDVLLNAGQPQSERNLFGDQFLATARMNVSDLFESQPLALGAIGLALGAGLAASLPITSTETKLLGEASANLQGAARDVADEQIARANEVVSGVATTVAREARVQGLTKEGLEDKANAVAGAIKNVLAQTTSKVQEQMH